MIEIKFVRVAAHINEIFKIKETVKFLKKNGYIVTVNIMQISELSIDLVKKISNFLFSLNLDVLYIADSLGSLKKKDIISRLLSLSINHVPGLEVHIFFYLLT